VRRNEMVNQLNGSDGASKMIFQIIRQMSEVHKPILAFPKISVSEESKNLGQLFCSGCLLSPPMEFRLL
jgi:hypothetical protein